MSGCHRTMEISLFKEQVIEAWQAMLVPHCEYWNFISLLSIDLPTLKRLIQHTSP